LLLIFLGPCQFLSANISIHTYLPRYRTSVSFLIHIKTRTILKAWTKVLEPANTMSSHYLRCRKFTSYHRAGILIWTREEKNEL
jgi:hypothetical protein